MLNRLVCSLCLVSLFFASTALANPGAVSFPSKAETVVQVQGLEEAEARLNQALDAYDAGELQLSAQAAAVLEDFAAGLGDIAEQGASAEETGDAIADLVASTAPGGANPQVIQAGSGESEDAVIIIVVGPVVIIIWS